MKSVNADNPIRGSLPVLLIFAAGLFLSSCRSETETSMIMTVNGPVTPSATGIWLAHEHILVDFIGADSIKPGRYDRAEVIRKVLPYLREAKEKGCRTFVECTPDYLGRDVELLKALADSTGLHILTNTGYYGAVGNKYMPAFALSMTAEDLSEIWTGEWKRGIGVTGIKPGFIKIAVERDTLSDFHETLVRASALTHLKTGLTIASHTGPALPAFRQIELLKDAGVDPEAFIWVHASNEKDYSKIAEAARMRAWVSLDYLDENNVGEMTGLLIALRQEGVLNRVLVSHDAGWYDPAKENGGEFRPFTTLFDRLIPELISNGFTESDIEMILETNPQAAFTVKIRKLNR